MTNPQRLPLLLLLALTLIAASSSVAGGKSKAAACIPKGAKTLAASSRVRVYRDAAPGPSQGRAAPFYGCLKSSGKSSRIGPVKRGGNASMSGPFGFRSTWAGAIESLQIGDTTWIYAAARNIQSDYGRRCLVGSADQAGQLPAVRVLLIDDNTEALAWAAITPSPTGHAPLIGACDTRGTRVLDSGAGVEIKTLELHGSTLSWGNAGGPQTAQLH